MRLAQPKTYKQRAVASGVADSVAPSMPAWRSRAAATVPYLLMAMVAGTLIQAYLGGAGYMADGSYFATHKSFVHLLELFPVLLAVAGFLGRDKVAAWSGVALFFLIGFQYGLVRADGLVRALHVANGFVIFGVALILLVQRWPWRKA